MVMKKDGKIHRLVTISRQFIVVLDPCEEGGFSVTVPELPGCISEGDTKREALDNITDAIRLYLKGVLKELSSSNKK